MFGTIAYIVYYKYVQKSSAFIKVILKFKNRILKFHNFTELRTVFFDRIRSVLFYFRFQLFDR